MCKILFVTMGEVGRFEKLFKKMYMTALQYHLNADPDLADAKLEFDLLLR